MMKSKLQIFCFCVVTFLQTSALAQSYPITVSVQVTPPYSPYISDYQDKAVLSFTNSSQQPIDVFIRGRIENDRGEYIQTMPNVFSNIPIHVPALQTVVVMGSQLDDNYLNLDNLQTNLSDQAYSNLFRLGMMPEGFYTFCIYAYSRDPNTNDYIPVSDPQSGAACFSYHVGYVSPPQILSPMPDEEVFPTPSQNVNISWTRPVGNVQNAMLVYDLYLVKVLPDEDPQVSLANAVEHEAGLFFKRSDIPVTNFQFTNLTTFQLEKGNDYALMIQARDLNGKTAFENNGRSEMAVFKYGPAAEPQAISGTIHLHKNASCSCTVNAASLDQTNNNASLKAGSSFTMASLTIQIGNLQAAGNTVSGEGTVLINKVPVQIIFSDIVVNKNGVAIEGNVTGKQANGFDFLKNGGAPVLSSSDYSNFLDQIRDYNINAIRNGIGIPLPFGLSSIAPTDAVNVGITALQITPQQATYDALAVVQLADAGKVLALSAQQVCFSNSSLMCGDALFVLDKDMDAGAGLTLKAYQSDDNPGTYVLMSGKEVKKFHINAEYGFPAELLTKLDGSQEKAVLDADAESWSDWTASLTMDPFKLNALSDFTFSLNTGAFYDHSSLKNPDGMPSSFEDADLNEKNAAIGNPLWTGFFIPGVTVSLPSFIKNINSSSDRLEVGATDLILDQDGLTGVIGASNVLSIGDGSLGGWYCSIDQIAVKILNSSYKTGGIYGKLVLPFSNKDDEPSQIAYSCTLSAMSSGGGFTYELVTEQKNDIDFYAWWAHINLNKSSITVTNNNSASSTVATAKLSGKLSLNGNIAGNKIDLNLIEVENLVVQTQEPYMRVEKITAGFSSPQHLVAWFPVNITNIKPTITGKHPGLQFDLTLFLSDINSKLLPTATTGLTVFADMEPDRPIWKPSGLQLNKVEIEGNLAGLVHIKKGSLEFFHDDPTFGDGIQGSLDASFAGLDAVEVSANVKFGNKSFNYWYFDASTTFPPIPVAPGISINGLGGGAYYNLKRTANDNISASDYFENISKYQVGAFTPQSGAFGFKAKVGVCTNDGFIFTGWAELGATFNTSGGFSISSIDGSGNGEFLRAASGVAKDASAPVKGAFNWHIGIADKVYSINGAVEIKEPPVGDATIKGEGWFEVMADVANNNYYLKIGEPANRNKVSLDNPLLNIDISAYFMAGNHIVASLPEPPIHLAGYQKINYNPDGGGLVFGASLTLKKRLEYLMFYVQATATMGFDVNFSHYTEGCNGSHDLPGMNGWYGLGQIYAELTGSGGLHVDLFFYEGEVEAFNVGVSVLLRGGMPDPYWFDGQADFHYSAFEGAVEGDVPFHFSFGDKCVPETQVFTMPLVQALKPADQTIDVPLNATPEVVFNYPAEKQFDLVVPDEDGVDHPRSYRIEIENCTVTNIENNKVFADYHNPASYPSFTDEGHKDLVLGPDEAFDAQTRYRLELNVTAKLLEGSSWNVATYHGEPVQGSQSAVFKTGDCKLDEYISDPAYRVGAYPFPNQRYFLQGESKHGAIILDCDYGCSAQPDEKYDLVVKFTALKNHTVVGTYEKPVIFNGNKSKYLPFDIPALPNDCLIRVEVIKRKQLSAADLYVLRRSNVPLVTAASRASSSNSNSRLIFSTAQYSAVSQSPEYLNALQNMKVNGTSPALPSSVLASNLKLSNKTMDIILYDYHFRTSRYNTLTEKMNAMGYSSTTGYSSFGSPTMNFRAVEKFDVYDANGFISATYRAGKVYYALPLVSFKETSNYNSWMKNHGLCLYQNFVAAGVPLNSAREAQGLSIQTIQHIGIACTGTMGFCVPLRPIDIVGYDPELSAAEIRADEVADFYLKSNVPRVVTGPSILARLKIQ